MNAPETPAYRDLEPARRLDQACNHFEDAWKAGRPRIEDHLGVGEGAERSALLRELVLLDIDYRRRAGEACHAQDYLARFPELGAGWVAGAVGGASGPGGSTLPHAAPRQPPTPAVGRFGDYELIREIARGGMGVVYEARQSALDRPVALKMILGGGHADDEDHRRFLVEAGAVAKVRHPNIVQIYEFGTHDGRPYFSMELCPTSLAKRLDGDPMPSKEAAALMEPIARAVHAAHQARILHRDLKPANVLLAEDGTPRVTDFGLAKRLEDAGHSLASGAFVGTPNYAAPEQALGRRDVGPPADVYSLGAILYECLTGRPPFKAASTVETLAAVVADDAAPVRQLNRSVPADLETICLRCLRKEPGRRYASAAALADDLRRFLEGRPIEARPVGQSERAFRWCRRNPAVAGLVAAVFLALALGAAVSSAYAVKADANAEEAGERERDAVREKERADALAVEAGRREREAVREKKRADEQLGRAELLIYVGKLAMARSAIEAADGASALQHLMECQVNRRGWEYRHLLKRVTGEQTLLGHTGAVLGVACSPDGKRILTGSWDATAKVWDAETGKELLSLRGHTGPVFGVAYRPDGRRIVTVSLDKKAKVWDAETGREILTLAGPIDSLGRQGYDFDGRNIHFANLARYAIGFLAATAYSPDGRRIITGSWNQSADRGGVKVWDADTGREILTLERNVGACSVAYSPDGKRFATGSFGSIKVWDAETGREVLSFKGVTRWVRSLAFSPDGTRIVVGGDRLQLWDAATGRVTRSFEGHKYKVTSVAFSPDGRRIAAGGSDRTVRVWDADTGEAVLALLGHFEVVRGVAYSPDGRRIVAGGDDQTARVWDAEKNQGILALDRFPSGSAAYSPDGKRIVTGNNDRTARVWDAATGRAILTLVGHTVGVWGVAYSPDGTRVVTGSQDKTAKVWDARTGRLILTLAGHAGGVRGVAYSPDGTRIVTGSEDRTAKVWDAQTGRVILTLTGHAQPVTSVSFSPDGKRVVTGSYDKTARVWDARTGRQISTLEGHTYIILGVAYSADGKRIATAGDDKTTRVWDTATGRQVLELRGHTAGVTGVALSPDGKRIATAGEGSTARVWESVTGREVLTLPFRVGTAYNVAFSPDGDRLLIGGQNLPGRVLDTGDGGEFLYLQGHTGAVNNSACSPDGTRVVTGSQDRTARVWDAETGRELLTLTGHAGGVWSVAYSPDGTRIVTGSWDNTARVWDARTGRQILTLQGNPSLVYRVAYSPDGKRIATANLSTTKVWDAETGREILTLEGVTETVRGLAFSPDGKRILVCDRDNHDLAWSAVNGKPIQPPSGPMPSAGNSRFVMVKRGAVETTVTLFDVALNGRRNAYPLPDAAESRRYHAEQADRAEGEGRWFAVAFHVGRYLHGDARDADLMRRRRAVSIRRSFTELDVLRRKGDLAGALARIRQVQAAAPEDAALNHYLAWMLLFGPEPKADAKRAVTLAKKAIGTTPPSWEYLRALGLAHHFAGEDREAVEVLNASLKLRGGVGEAFDYFPLAAAHQRLGRKEEARKWYDRGVEWSRRNGHPYAAELAVLRAHAGAALDIPK